MGVPSIKQAGQRFLDTVQLARSKNTHATYGFALQAFQAMLTKRKVDLDGAVSDLPEDAIAWFADDLKGQSAATELLYLQAARAFFKYLAAEQLAQVNLPRLDLLKQQRARRPGIRLPQFPVADIDRIIQHISSTEFVHGGGPNEQLRALRDRAFILTLADTGLRVHEACMLRRGQIDWNEGRAIVVGKGNKQAVVRFSSRSLRALKAYLGARAGLDGAAGKSLASLPLFARHDKGAGSAVKPITRATGALIVRRCAAEALGSESSQRITPHSLRHYFVTTVLRGSGNLKLAQELARHANIQVTQRYAHLSDDELDRGYHEIFEEDSRARKD